MDKKELLELIDTQQKQIKLLSEQVNLLKERGDLHREMLEGLVKNVSEVWDFLGKVLKIKKPKK